MTTELLGILALAGLALATTVVATWAYRRERARRKREQARREAAERNEAAVLAYLDDHYYVFERGEEGRFQPVELRERYYEHEH